MKKRILALVLALAVVVPAFSVFVGAVPYSPSANAWKDFSQEHNYIYEVKAGSIPKIDGLVTESDGYGEPIATYAFRYTTSATRYRDDFDNGEYKLRDDGEYYVYPTSDTPDEVWKSIAALETNNPFGYIYGYYLEQSSFKASTNFYFHNEESKKFVRAYGVTADNFNDYTAVDNSGNYALAAVQRFDVGEPVNWETNYMDYYTKVGSYYKPVEAVNGKAPEFKVKTYYHGTRIKPDRLFVRSSASTSVLSVASLRRDHVPVPEEVNLYARYDDQYLYYAIEVYEPAHKYVYYNNSNYWGTTMSNSPFVFSYSYDYANYYRRQLTADSAQSGLLSTIRTYVNAATDITDTAPILAKFGNPDATYNQVQVSGIDYSVVHTPAPVKAAPTDDEMMDEEFGGDMGMEETSDPITRTGIKESLRSGTYGKTVYEYRLPWVVINGKYNPDTCKTAVPEMFTVTQSVQLDSTVGKDTHTFSLTIPRYAYKLPGSFAEEHYLFRYPDRTGLTEGDKYGTYNFYWRSISASTMWTAEAFTTDYSSVSDRKTATPPNMAPVFFTAGKEPAKGYVQPGYAGASIRVDNAEAQKIRIKINVPATEKEIAEVGAIVAPTEVVRSIQLKLGISSVAYYAYDNPVLYGVVDGKWINLTTNAEKYFETSVTPNDSDSFISYEEYGGKPSGVYTVHTLPVADLENPYDIDKEGNKIYTVVYGGANGNGIYNDFDDFNTFYTIRPYIKYKDGTVTYGEHEYKSIYYIACQLIQPMLTDYNVTVVGSTALTQNYNMDMMPLTTYKDAEGNVVTDRAGNPIYLPVEHTGSESSTSSYSPYSGAREYSIYLPARRAEVFRWYATRTVSRRNNNTPLRVDEYETFDANTKLLVKQYEDMYENLWKVITAAEGNRYIIQK